MGTDNLFHKRKKRAVASLRREQARRSPYDVVLIVCEGGKTEPNYFHELKDAYRLNTANIKIVGDCGSSPKDVVEHAIKTYKASRDYDRVFCIFDRDTHSTYLAALDRIQQTKLSKDHSIHAIPSVPCFEIWFLMHFTYSTKAYVGGTGSICQKVLDDLKKHLPEYNKGTRGVFHDLQDRMEVALKHAEQLARHCKRSDTDNPSTKVHELVKYLRDIKKINY